jgi:hypothetical protein
LNYDLVTTIENPAVAAAAIGALLTTLPESVLFQSVAPTRRLWSRITSPPADVWTSIALVMAVDVDPVALKKRQFLKISDLSISAAEEARTKT